MNEPTNGNGKTPRIDPLHDTAAKGVEAIHAIVLQRDELLHTCERQAVDISLYRERNTQLESRLSTATAERDHYMRYCTELTARLNNIQVLISSTIEEAKRAAYRPTNVTTPHVNEKDVKQLEGILSRLAQNGEPVPQ